MINIGSVRHLVKGNGKKNRGTVQFDLDGNFVKKFETIKDAAKELGISHAGIILTCQGKRSYASGYQWKYADTFNEEDFK